ncbi:MAG TPA: hypothetical protein VNY56_07030 [Methylomirabilota bacterium]|jgi:hypothetical protein|nr:hypothetical protein [Methylomirabilota bacterium]
MGFFDSWGSLVACPVCGTRRASKFLWKIKCRNPNCRNFDTEYAAKADLAIIRNKNAAEVFSHLKGTFTPGVGSIRIRYENFRGDHLNYIADAKDAYRAGEFVVMRVAPTGRRIAFRLSSIQNRGELEASLASQDTKNIPNVRERRILDFHLRRGTSSQLFREVREKYPEYRP